MKRLVTTLIAAQLLGVAAAEVNLAAREPVIGGPCEGCEAVFDGLPDSPGWQTRLAPPSEPGEPLRIDGTVRDARGRPVAGVIVYAYHTNQRGVYPRDEQRRGGAAYRHGMLRGWAETDARGRYRFDTIRPASYPNTTIPQHIHMHVIEPGCCTYYISDIVFDDDPLLTASQRRRMGSGRGGHGLVTPEREGEGRWRVRRDIVLGKGAPRYARHERRDRPRR